MSKHKPFYWRRAVMFPLLALVESLLLSGCGMVAESTPLVPGADGVAILGVPIPPKVQNLTPTLQYFLDPEYAWDLKRVTDVSAAAPFQPTRQTALNMGFVGDPVWMRFSLRNETERAQEFTLEITNPRLARVEFFAPDSSGSYAMTASGAAAAFEERQVLHAAPAFKIHVAPGATETCYLHIVNNGSLRMSALLWREDAFAYRLLTWRLGVSMLMGALLVMTFYHLFVYFTLREVPYLYLAVMTALFFLYQAARTGIGPLVFWRNAPYWSTHSVVTLIMLVTAAATFFVESFLETSKNNPRLSIYLRVLGWGNIISGLFGLTDLMIKYYLAHFLGVVTAGTVLVVVVQQLRMGSRPARIFIAGWGLMLMSALVFALVGPGFIPSNLVTENFVEVGLMTAALLCSIALADRIKVREAEQRMALETAVTRRTAELQAALDEVKTLSGLLPICSHCKKIRDDNGYWNSLEKYLYEHTDALLSHGICPECAQVHYPEVFGKRKLNLPEGKLDGEKESG